ncbi:MAG: septum formation initiator family protein [Oscillospiraceae bacterium]|nr:septum formation initiator family protein [Oscillospiraceae bacterium]
MKKNKKSYFNFIFFIFCFYCIWNIVFTQVEIKKQTKQLEIAKQKYQDQIDTNEEYKNIIELETNDEYIKRVAREKLDFISQDERVFIDISSK